MLKFFRKYNKFILAIGAAFLMLAFLIQPTLSLFMTGPEDRPIGEVDGTTLTAGDQEAAAGELEVLQRIHPAVGTLANILADGDPLKWLLMKYDAQRLGLTASDAEVQSLLETLGLYEEELRQRSTRLGVSSGYIQEALRSWLTLEHYRDLMLGRTHVNPLERLQAMAVALQVEQSGNFQLMMQVQAMMAEAFGHQRLSEPLIRHMMRDLRTTVAGELAVVEANRYLDETEQPTQQEVQALFEQYRDVAPGESEPYGFGYRIPARVKVEYLEIPIERAREQVELEEVDLFSYYEQNRDQFRNDDEDVEAGDPEHQPYEQVRAQIEDELRDREAEQLADRMVRAGEAQLVQHARRLEQEGAYRVVSEDYQPPSLAEVADALERQFDVQPERFDDMADEWVPLDELSALPGIGRARLVGRPDIRFTDYVRSARELEPDVNNPLVSMGLQATMPGRPLEGDEGSRYLFRLVEAEPAHAPESLAEVEQAVRRDAHLRKAYEQQLVPAMEQWLADAREQGLESLAESEDLVLEPVRPTPRRQPGPRGQLAVPSVPGVGRSEALIDGMFDVAERVSDGGRKPLDDVDEAERLGVAEVDARLSVAIYRVDAYQPVTENQYREMIESQPVGSWVSQMIMGPEADPLAAPSSEAVRARVNFEPAERVAGDEDEAPSPATGTQRRPGQI